MQEIGVSSTALRGGEHCVAALLVHDTQERQCYQHDQGGAQREEEKQRRRVAGKRDARDQSVKKGAQAKRRQRESGRAATMGWPVECCCLGQ